MIEPALKAFEGLLSDFTWRRLTALVVLTLYIGLLFTGVEAVTGHYRLARIEHATNTLSRLQDIQAKQSPQILAVSQLVNSGTSTLVNLLLGSPESLSTPRVAIP